MKKFVSVILSIILVITSFATNAFSEEEKTYSSMGDVELLGDIEDVVFASLENDLQSDNYIVENVVAIYIYLRSIWMNWHSILYQISSLDIHWKKLKNNSKAQSLFSRLEMITEL